MKKHIFGFVLFSLIVASFVLVYVFFNAPSIPPKEAVKPPISRTETREEKPYYCNLRRNKISYEVQNPHLSLSFGQLTAKLKLNWNGMGKLPKEVYVTPYIFTLDNTKETFTASESILTRFNKSNLEFSNSKFLIEPFNDSNEIEIAIQSTISNSKLLEENNNYYVVFDISTEKSEKGSFDVAKKLEEAKSVLLSPRIKLTTDGKNSPK